MAPRALIGLNWNCPNCGAQVFVAEEGAAPAYRRRRRSHFPWLAMSVVGVLVLMGGGGIVLALKKAGAPPVKSQKEPAVPADSKTAHEDDPGEQLRARVVDHYRTQVIFAIGVCLIFEIGTVGTVCALRARPADPFRTGLLWGCSGGAVLGLLGFVLSQFAPISGGIMETYFAQPFSIARLLTMPAHVLGFGAVGVVIGGVAGVLKAKS